MGAAQSSLVDKAEDKQGIIPCQAELHGIKKAWKAIMHFQAFPQSRWPTRQS